MFCFCSCLASLGFEVPGGWFGVVAFSCPIEVADGSLALVRSPSRCPEVGSRCLEVGLVYRTCVLAAAAVRKLISIE